MAKNKTLELSIKIAGKMDKSLTAALASSQGQLGSFAKVSATSERRGWRPWVR
ncbi:MAG: hypothetical protein ACLU9S_16205 [Oscillospiraceae bacterium]